MWSTVSRHVPLLACRTSEHASRFLTEYTPTMNFLNLQAILLLFSGLCARLPPGHATATLARYPSQPIPLDALFDNVAATSQSHPHAGPAPQADFDGHGGAYDRQFLPTGAWEYDGLTFALPSSWDGRPDNVRAAGQVLRLPSPTRVHELHFLYAGDGIGPPFRAPFTLHFADNSSFTVELYAHNWWIWAYVSRAAINTPYHLEKDGGANRNASNIFQWSTSIPSESKLEGITFPGQAADGDSVHVFALSITPCAPVADTPALAVRRARFTTRWQDVAGVGRAQAVEVTLANLLPSSSLTLNGTGALTRPHTLSLAGPGLRTVVPGVLNRLVPGGQARVDVLVTGANSHGNGSAVVEVRDAQGTLVGVSPEFETAPLVERWTADEGSLARHETPGWWNAAKFGIFIHWGVYSVPAWAPPGTYAEWYDWTIRQPPNASNPTWAHHLETYGKDVVYDDFIPAFTAAKFNASAWVDLFARAGAKYFVLVTKHHDGFALFDTGNTTHRNSVRLGPRRDLVAELLQTAKAEQPGLHRGTYFSMPEWFNPDYAKYGFSSWPGGLAHNAFGGAPALEPYTGHLNISDYLADLQLPQMVDLAVKYDTEIMWCDIGGPNKTLEFAAAFYNHAMAQGRQVTMNDRCGVLPDFDTPEYTSFGSIQTDKWESSEGRRMDPFSYGLNSATNASQYKNGTTIIQTLVDIVSKNGNFLLDIGPTAEGEIIAPMMDNLLDAGAWLDFAGECVYDTEYWFPASQDPNPQPGTAAPRFTTTPTAFCIVAFSPPLDGQVTINKRLPVLAGDEIVLLRPQGPSAPLAWDVDAQTGRLVIDVPEEDVRSVDFAWAFRVRYKLD
ncbi:glycoside hydrolase family 29 protein [Mycena belliarum]|uniref:alpha-L-fucosidase n=1 Tax=Mycena belliarum TaxID=1033014 RepID=A0AAD6TQF3_9AGAR|nr:glycoside hydrolase family 29 protein [Mycena belliae]